MVSWGLEVTHTSGVEPAPGTECECESGSESETESETDSESECESESESGSGSECESSAAVPMLTKVGTASRSHGADAPELLSHKPPFPMAG